MSSSPSARRTQHFYDVLSRLQVVYNCILFFRPLRRSYCHSCFYYSVWFMQVEPQYQYVLLPLETSIPITSQKYRVRKYMIIQKIASAAFLRKNRLYLLLYKLLKCLILPRRIAVLIQLEMNRVAAQLP